MVKTKSTARKDTPSGSSRPSHHGDSDYSQERARPKKRVPPPRRSPSEDSSEGYDYEDELAHMEREESLSLFAPLLPSPGLGGPHSSLLLLRSNLTVMLAYLA